MNILPIYHSWPLSVFQWGYEYHCHFVGNQKVNTDFVTGTLNSLARTAALFVMNHNKDQRNEYKANIFLLLFLWLGFLSGALAPPFLLAFQETGH